ncbi:MAG: hypothetical protein NTV36_01440, partial [Candidatus Staskawiczbacteria bacterium]|nr:hypothetical protein [Candidatus Staskawiczbacteria bacterium]
MAETSKAGSKTGKPRKKKTVAVEVTNVVTEEVGLAKIQKEFSLDVNLFDIDFAKFSAKTGIEEIYEIVQKVREGVPSVLKKLAHKDEDLASIEDRDLRRVAVQDWAKKQDELEGYLERVLTAEYPPIKATAAMAYLRHCLTTPFK